MASLAAAIATNRFGLGARPGELADAARDPRGWLLAQLDGPGTVPAALRDLPSADAALGALRAAQAAKDQPAAQAARDAGRALYEREAQARLLAQATAPDPFRERLVAFWSNHFTVSRRKAAVTGVVHAFEREAIRPHVTGRLADLVLAAARHPAMLVYLDADRSIGPGSQVGRRRDRGLNENLARELLELHTLGVRGGYGQPDVAALAAILTGWGVDEAGRFTFRAAAHEPGTKTLLGRTYAGQGLADGEAAIERLATHPATAAHVAEKLARHLAGEPAPPALAARLARALTASGGDLKALYRAAVEAPEPFAVPLARVKQPVELVVSTARALEAESLGIGDEAPLRRLARSQAAMGQPPFAAPSPAGWPDEDAVWATPEALVQRIDWAMAVGRAVASRRDARALAAAVLGPIARDATREAIVRAASAAEAVAVLIAAPEFQRR